MTKNRKRAFIILAAGIVIAIISVLVTGIKGEKDSRNRFERNEFGEGEKDISVIAVSSLGEEEILYSLGERQLSESEVEAMLPEFLSFVEKAVLGENESSEQVYKPLNFMEEADGYPFDVCWSWEPRNYIDSKGNIKEEVKEEICVMLTADIEYGDFMYSHTFPIVLVPQSYTPAEEWRRELEDALFWADASNPTDTYILLPEEVKGQAVNWKMQQENKGIKIAGFCVLAAMVFFFADSVEEKERAKKRIQYIRKEYPEFVLKCSMLIGSGMTLRQVFERLAKAYIKDKKKERPLYEEVLIGVRELENGVAEREVYERFGRRCGIRETQKFGNLMSRNLRKGSEGLKGALREEAAEAMELHKEQIKKQGETAGTKLLFPMLILLLIVMVIIMVPAFGTFSI